MEYEKLEPNLPRDQIYMSQKTNLFEDHPLDFILKKLIIKIDSRVEPI